MATDMWEPYRASLYDRKPLESAEAVRESIHDRARAKNQKGAATVKQLGYMNGLLGQCFTATDSDMARHEFLEYVTGSPTSKGLSGNLASAIIDWCKDPHADGPHWVAVQEAHMVIREWAREHGQEALL